MSHYGGNKPTFFAIKYVQVCKHANVKIPMVSSGQRKQKTSLPHTRLYITVIYTTGINFYLACCFISLTKIMKELSKFLSFSACLIPNPV